MGHWRTVAWMASLEFQQVKQNYDTVLGPGAVYFRPTGNGVIVISLDPAAPGYVGHKANQTDNGHILRAGSKPPTVDELKERDRHFKRWLRGVRRSSVEEQAVIPWISQALKNNLRLGGWLKDWLFLNQEWRFVMPDGRGRKSDILAVHRKDGRLGIVEAKDDRAKSREAKSQAQKYAMAFLRDADELARLFTAQLNAMGKLYENAEARELQVSTAPPALFFGYPSGIPVRKLKVEPL